MASGGLASGGLALTVDWSKCFICGKAGGEDLRCPLDSSQGNGYNIYCIFLEAVEAFQKINALPVSLPNEILKIDVLVKNMAKWHKLCYLKFNKTKLQRAQMNSKKRHADTSFEEKEVRKSKRLCASTPLQRSCIFCNTNSASLHSCSTIELDNELKQMALELQDSQLMSRISGGDIIAIEAKYHINCLVSYKNRYRSMRRAHVSESSSNTEGRVLQARAFSELISNIEDNIENGTYLFKLKDLHDMFTNRLQALGITKTINKTRLKDDIMGNFFGPLCGRN